MKLHMKKILIIGLVSTFCAAGAMAQESRTGSHLESNSTPSQILYLSRPDEVGRIRQLLARGQKTQALTAAQEYVERIERTTLIQETSPRYYAYNALCSVHTSLSQFEEAIAACSTAMSLEPGKWSAINNRGTAHLVSGQLRQALEDYQLALVIAPEGNTGIAATIEHNINLVEQGL